MDNQQIQKCPHRDQQKSGTRKKNNPNIKVGAFDRPSKMSGGSYRPFFHTMYGLRVNRIAKSEKAC